MTDLVRHTGASASPVLTPTERPAGLFVQNPRECVRYATQVADVLKDVIVQQRLSVRVGGGDHIKAEGWATLGTLLGILPRERQVIEHDNGDYEAFVDLVRQGDGVVVGGASAICGKDEKRWSSAERYARRSMAVTRATSKAYRLTFAWVVALAGYAPTPAEEMEDIEVVPTTSAKSSPAKQKATPLYQNTTPEQAELAKSLKAWKVPEAIWETIGERLKGRPATDGYTIAQEVMSEHQPEGGK